MNETAILHATDDVLKKNGIVANGDIIRLKVLCRNADHKTRKIELKSIIEGGVSTRVAPTSAASSRGKRRKASAKKKSFYLSWERFCVVKAEKCGGSRNERLPVTFGYDDILKRCKELFWENRRQSSVGRVWDTNFYLVDFRRQIISRIATCNDEQVPFTIDVYCDIFKMVRNKIIFRTKSKTEQIIQALLRPLSPDVIDVDDIPIQSSTPKLETPETTQTAPGPSWNTSQLIGSSEEWEVLRKHMGLAYQESLQADREKDLQNKSETAEAERLIDLQQKRRSRVPPEPTLEEDHAAISVCHADGNKSRFFLASVKMVAVYDWVGSLSLHPEHFELIDYNGKVVVPEMGIISGIYNIGERV